MGKPICIITKRRLIETPYRSISDRIFHEQPNVRKNNSLCWRNKIQLAMLNVCFHSSHNLDSYRLQNKKLGCYLSVISSEKQNLIEINFHDEDITLDTSLLWIIFDAWSVKFTYRHCIKTLFIKHQNKRQPQWYASKAYQMNIC